MAYCTLDDLKKARSVAVLVQLTDGTGTTPVSDVTTAAISAADAEIEGCLSGRYPVPLTSTPPLIKNCSVLLALEYLYARRDSIPDAVKDQAARTRAILDDIRCGKIALYELTESFSTSDYLSSDYTTRRFDPELIMGDETENDTSNWLQAGPGDDE